MHPSRFVSKFAFSILVILVFAGLSFLILQTGVGNYALDDAYIVEHSIDGIISNGEDRFLDSTPWEGITSPVYAGAILLFTPVASVQFAHWLVNCLAALAAASGWYFICKRNSIGNALGLLVALVSLMVGLSYYQFTNGLETGMAMAALTWMLIALDYNIVPKWAYVLAGVECFIRPELVALTVIFVIYVSWRRPNDWIEGMLIAISSFGVVAIVLFAVSGTLVPNTLSAKTYFFAEGCKPDLFKFNTVMAALREFSSELGLFSIGFLMAMACRQRLVIILFVGLFLTAYFYSFPGALHHNGYRYLYLLLPIATFGWVACLSHPGKFVRFTSNVLAVFVIVFLLISANSRFQQYASEVQIMSRDYESTARWVEKNISEDAVVLVHDAGRISTLGSQPLVDMVGLKSRFSTEIHRRTTYTACGRVPSAISEIAKNAGASFMVVGDDWDRIFGLVESLRIEGWSVQRVDGSRGASHYKIYRINLGRQK